MSNYMIWALIALCLGYFLGRYAGWKEGMEEGMAYAPIQLRAQALHEGSCPLCQTAFSPKANCEEIDT